MLGQGNGLNAQAIERRFAGSTCRPILKRQITENAVPGNSRCVFRALACAVPGIDTAHDQGYVQRCTNGLAMLLKSVRCCLQPVVYVNRPDLPRPFLAASQQQSG